MTGSVNAELEATVTIEVVGPSGLKQSIEVGIDTGFNGFLTLPLVNIIPLGLAHLGREEGILADGSSQYFDYFQGIVLLNGLSRNVEIDAIDAPPLAGMALLKGLELRIEVKDGGKVAITELP